VAVGELAWRVERACRNAWPALRTVWLDDWQLRLGEGLTRRANSANPLRPDYRDRAALVAACEALYSSHEQPAIFRLPTIIDPALDRRLAALGYESEGESLALYGEIAGVVAAADPAVQLLAQPGEEWFAAMSLLQGYSEGQGRTYRRIVAALAVPAVFALLTVDGEPAALAYGALSEGLLCYESVVADRRRRRQGLARRIVSSLAAWGGEQGIEGVCLDVEAASLGALALYERIGLKTELYRYHYRRQPPVLG
jgi:ribosomal protein S18 acetylase RimI-like enzyme